MSVFLFLVAAPWTTLFRLRAVSSLLFLSSWGSRHDLSGCSGGAISPGGHDWNVQLPVGLGGITLLLPAALPPVRISVPKLLCTMSPFWGN
eukprot:g77704.t1